MNTIIILIVVAVVPIVLFRGQIKDFVSDLISAMATREKNLTFKDRK